MARDLSRRPEGVHDNPALPSGFRVIRLALAGAAVWATERIFRWACGAEPYEPRHAWRDEPQSVTVTSDGITRWYGNGMMLDELIGERE